jgi:hypothetical protein
MSTEPCGSLPVATIDVSATYCVVHQAWSAISMTTRQTADDDICVEASAKMSFGPFDDEDEVRAWMLRALLAMEDVKP